MKQEAEKKRVPLNMPMETYLRLKRQADLAQESMNRYILKLIGKKNVVIIPGLHGLYAEVYRIRTQLERLELSDNTAVRKLIERCDGMCRSCDTLLAAMIKNIN